MVQSQSWERQFAQMPESTERVLEEVVNVDFLIGELGANPAIAGACRQSRVFGALSLVVTQLLAEVARVVQAPPETFRCFPFRVFAFAIALAFAWFALTFSFTLAFAFGTFSEKKRIPYFL